MKELSEWFDPYNQRHVEAWAEAQRNCAWPDWFFGMLENDGVFIDEHWFVRIPSKLAKAWVDSVLNKESRVKNDR